MKGIVKIRGLSLDTSTISDKLDDLQIILEEVRKNSYKEEIIKKELKPTLWQKIKGILNSKIF